MTRRPILFPCAGVTLAGMLDCDTAHGGTGLLIVTGGSEIRAGAFAGQARLAARLAREAGVPVLRFDRRGVGDSEGDNPGWRGSAPDIAAALAALREAVPGLRRIVAYGLCDAAAALMLHAQDLGVDALVLANPWTFDSDEDGPATLDPADLRRRYLSRLADPRALARLVTGRVNLVGLARGLVRAATPAAPPATLAATLHAALAAWGGPATILLSEGDRTARRFRATWPEADPRVQSQPGVSHAFAGEEADWLFERLKEATASRH